MLVTWFVAGTRYPENSNVREGICHGAQFQGIQSITAEKTWQQELAKPGHIRSTVRKQKDKEVGTSYKSSKLTQRLPLPPVRMVHILKVPPDLTNHHQPLGMQCSNP